MIDVRFQPIKNWNGSTEEPIDSPFGKWENGRGKVVPFGKTLDLLESELRHLKATNITIEADFAFDQIRNDGWPYSGVKPKTSRVALSFDSTKGSIRIPCSRFKDYLSNLRAIALSLEALRKVDRYGVTMSNEQYRGWAQLPPGPSWKETLGINGEAVTADLINQKFRSLAKELHPDKGGNDSQMALLVSARDAGLKSLE